MYKTTKTPLRNHKRLLRLLGWRSGEPRSKTTSQEGRDLKFDTDLPWCILWISINSKSPRLLPGTTSVLLDSLDDALENQRVRPLPRKVDIWKLIQTFHVLYYGYPLRQKSPRLLPGTTSALLDSVDDTLENPGIKPLPRKVEIGKLIETFLDVYYGYPLCQQPPRLLSGTTSVLLDSLDDTLGNPGVRPLLRNPGVRPLPRKVEIWNLIQTFLDVY